MLEIDMLAIGAFKSSFAGPPTNTVTQIPALTVATSA
jgi:acetolactate synthase-1/2/3 large subunit